MMKPIKYGWTWDGMSPLEDMRVEPDADQVYVKLEDFLAVWQLLQQEINAKPQRMGGAIPAPAPDPGRAGDFPREMYITTTGATTMATDYPHQEYEAVHPQVNTPPELRVPANLLANWQGTTTFAAPNAVELPADLAERAAIAFDQHITRFMESLNARARYDEYDENQDRTEGEGQEGPANQGNDYCDPGPSGAFRAGMRRILGLDRDRQGS